MIFGESQAIVEVKEATNEGFFVKKKIADGSIFIYGKEVNDFHAVDYEALSTLTISATQALVKKINDLEAKNKKQEAELNNLSSRISNIEEMLKLTAKK